MCFQKKKCDYVGNVVISSTEIVIEYEILVHVLRSDFICGLHRNFKVAALLIRVHCL